MLILSSEVQDNTKQISSCLLEKNKVHEKEETVNENKIKNRFLSTNPSIWQEARFFFSVFYINLESLNISPIKSYKYETRVDGQTQDSAEHCLSGVSCWW